MTKNISLTILIYHLFIHFCFSQEELKPAVESFENKSVIGFYDLSQDSNLSFSTDHYRFGKNSLKWQWKGDSFFGTNHFRSLSHKDSNLKYGNFFPTSPVFLLAIYNETPQDEEIKISFIKNENEDTYFTISLNFSGWRRIWVPFYEIKGNVPLKGKNYNYDYFKISTKANEGTLYFDDIVFSQYQDDRHQYPDYVVPFIKRNTNLGSDHWMPLIKHFEAIKALKTVNITDKIKKDLVAIEQSINGNLLKGKSYKKSLKNINKRFEKFQIKNHKNNVTGPPLTFRIEEEYFDSKQQGVLKTNDINDLGKLLKSIAVTYNKTINPKEKQELEEKFLLASRYYLDQGWQEGTSGGTRHHIGYAVRELTEAFYLMRNQLKKNSLLNDIGASLHWLFNLGMILDDEEKFHVNIDYLNTQSYYHLMLIFLTESKEKQAALLEAYSNYISITLAQENEEWGFKVDGTSWHHNGHYPAYGMGAFRSVPKLIQTLADTKFRIKKEAHFNFKRALLTTRKYSQLYDFGFGNAGRHPLEDNSIKSLKESFLQMALSGNPENTSKIDTEVASAYLRLWGEKDKKNNSFFTQKGIVKENLEGYFVLPLGATAIHRKNNWTAIIKGYSKYVWSSEIYASSNRYGRYPANGTVQILTKKGEKGNGFIQDGWDWNRYPSSTIIYLPFKELETELPLLMFRSEESFAGMAKLNKDGVFGMILNESLGTNADGDNTNKLGFKGRLKAKKSIFSFGDKLICIGTDISSVNEKNPVQTNIFQTFIKNKDIRVETSENTLINFPSLEEIKSNKKGKWIMDPYGNGYHIISNSSIKVQKKEQHSYHNKYSINTGKMHKKGKGVKETVGNFASAWIEHGNAPKNESYQYVIYPQINESNKLQDKISKDKSYQIKRADNLAHVVINKDNSTTAYVIFNEKVKLKTGVLNEVSSPSIIMIKEDSNKAISISAVNPDLNFKEYKKGKFINSSRPVSLSFSIKGLWELSELNSNISLKRAGKTTYITLESKNGLPTIFNMVKL